MKIIYSSAFSHSRNDIFPNSDSRIGLNEYTFTHIFNGLEHGYDFDHYRAGHDFYKWVFVDDEIIGFSAKQNRIEDCFGDSKYTYIFIDQQFKPIKRYGVSEINDLTYHNFFSDTVFLSPPLGTSDTKRVLLKKHINLNEPAVAELKANKDEYEVYRAHELGVAVLLELSEGGLMVNFYDKELKYKNKLQLDTVHGSHIQPPFVYKDRLYLFSSPLDFFCISLRSHEVLWHFKSNWASELNVYLKEGMNIADVKACIQARDEYRWALVDLDTGKIIQDVNIELSQGILPVDYYKQERSINYQSFYCEEFVFCTYSLHLLLVYDAKTGKKLHEIAIPNEFSFLSFMGFKSDCFYFYLKHSASAVYIPYSGILIIPREELLSQEPLTLELEDKGDIHHNIIPDGEFESYEVVASYDNMGDALRFIQIEMNTIVCLHSYTHYSQGTSLWKLYVNQKFNGKVTIKIDRDKLKDRDDRKFDQMVSLYNEYYQEISFAPIGAKLKRPVHAQVTWEYF